MVDVKKIMVFLFVLVLVLGAGCVSSHNESVKDKCIALCKEAKSKGVDLSAGPCLSDNNPSWDVKDWVCDVAHNPRQEVDNLARNQCQEFRRGEAKHFVEVTPNCEFIREY